MGWWALLYRPNNTSTHLPYRADGHCPIKYAALLVIWADEHCFIYQPSNTQIQHPFCWANGRCHIKVCRIASNMGWRILLYQPSKIRIWYIILLVTENKVVNHKGVVSTCTLSMHKGAVCLEITPPNNALARAE
jgi:hypothetical protein